MAHELKFLGQRLGLLPQWYAWRAWERGAGRVGELRPDADDYDRAWHKLRRADDQFLAALACYYADEHELTRSRARSCLKEGWEFFFGQWRTTFINRYGPSFMSASHVTACPRTTDEIKVISYEAFR
jgi:hypothetical protein